MTRKKLKKILLKHYAEPSMFAILRGIRRPSYELILKMYKEDKVPFDIWENLQAKLT